jgi:electron-transferring-flavoprotein dehydrogenase
VSFGLVAGLDYKDHNLDVHYLLQKLKQHPLFKKHLEGGQIQEWGAKTIPEGGIQSWPTQLSGAGLVMAGDAVGFVNVPALKGIHYAMKSGVLAAEAAAEALGAGRSDAEALARYDQRILESFIAADLFEVRNMRPSFKDGFWAGAIQAGLATITKGRIPTGDREFHADADDLKFVGEVDVEKTGLSKVDAVYLSGNKTRDDIPSHLSVGKDIPPEVAAMYVAMCPAGVYELQGDKLLVNAPNCIDCKATDVLGPRWRPREGGSGPDYKLM